MTLGDLIRVYITRNNITYEDFAKRCGLTKGYISMLVNNRNPKTGKPLVPRISTYHNIAQCFGMTLNELFDLIDDSPVQIGGGAELTSDDYILPEPQPLPTQEGYEKAALKAAEILIKHNICAAPIMPLPILKAIPGILVVSFTEMADHTGLDRKNLVTMYGAENQDAVTFMRTIEGEQRYYVAYNQRLPFYMLQRSLARELGHIVLKHDTSMAESIRSSEALYFVRHLLCPRPLLKGLMEKEIPLTVEVVGNITGCYGRSIAGIRETPGARVPAELNRQIKSQFEDYIRNFIDFHAIMGNDVSILADFGTYMDNYVE